MVLGRLMRSIGLGKGQSEHEQPLADSTSADAEDSISIKAAVLEKDCGSRGSIEDEALGDNVEDAEDSDDSYNSSKGSSRADGVYSKTMLLCVRASLCEQRAGERSPVSDDSMSKPYSTKSQTELQRTCPATSKSLDAMTPTAGSWMAVMKQRRSSCTDEQAEEDKRINRKACAILNKLTVEKFDSLYEQLVACGIKKPQHLQMLMSEVFNKATTQHHFIPMYADLCVRLEQDSRICSFKEDSGKQYSFRRLLLNQCQISFEKLLEPDDVKEADVDEEYRLRRKQQALGNIKLIGQLLVHGIVTSKLLVECSEELLRCQAICAEALESLAALISVAGKQFDNSNWQYHPRLLEVFSCMRALSKDKAVQARIRFLLRDVLDIRDAGWSQCTYKATLNAAPMKLDEVRESAGKEGKYIPFDEQIETDNLLAGLQRISTLAAAKKEAGSSTPVRTPGSKSGRNKGLRSSSSMAKESTTESSDDGTGRQKSEKTSETTSSPGTAKGAKPNFTEVSESQEFDLSSFRRSLSTILADLASDRNVPAAVRRIRLQEVPTASQAKEFADIITRVVEERRGPVRRCALAFAAGLAAADPSAFERNACLDGVGLFFKDVYPDLCSEIPRLPAIVSSELLPTLRNVFPKPELDSRLPSNL